MNRIKVTDEEFFYYLKDEWEHNIQLGLDPVWLSTQAFLKKLSERGVPISWSTLQRAMERLLKQARVEQMCTSNGTCWKPIQII